MPYSSFSWWRGHGIHPHIWVLGDRAKKKKSVIIGAYVYEFISEVPMPLSVFYLVQRTVRVTVIDDRLGGEEGWGR